MTYQWNLASFSEDERRAAEELSCGGALLPTTAKLLALRGVRNQEEATHFLRPSISDLHDPFLMTDMHKAVKRLNKAIGQKQSILVYGDYDVDGTTAVTLVYSYFRRFTSHIHYYIPDRYAEGSGISPQSIDFAQKRGCKLMIALDCGIKSVEMVDYAQTKGIDLIICDHHMPGETRPNAIAILNPKCPESTYPFDELSGCGVGFKLAQAFAIDNGADMRPVYDLLDLVAVSIGADLVRLTGENRVLATLGLKNINKNPRIGLKSIIDVSDIKSRFISMNEVVFKIGPRINASGRMERGVETVDLLLAHTHNEARKMCKVIDAYNSRRRELDKKTTSEAFEMVETSAKLDQHKILVMYGPHWHRGVIGIVASRLTERYNRPSVVITRSGSEGIICGSARSIGGFDVYNVVEECKDLLLNFGGHAYASGFTLKEDKIELLIKRINAYASGAVTPEILMPQIHIDLEINLSDISAPLRKQLRELAPYGPGNPKPIFLTRAVEPLVAPKFLGKNRSHVKLLLKQSGSDEGFNAFAYNAVEKMKQIPKGVPLDIVYTIEEYNYMGKTHVQLLLQDFKASAL